MNATILIEDTVVTQAAANDDQWIVLASTAYPFPRLIQMHHDNKDYSTSSTTDVGTLTLLYLTTDCDVCLGEDHTLEP